MVQLNDASATLHRVLADSGLSKSALCARAGISRALFDAYLNGSKQPSMAQILRIADAAGYRARVTLTDKPRPVSPEYIAAMHLADQLAGKRNTLPPLRFPHHLWRARR
jgi:transcriptional regulator with XRE-family HTH domain